MGVSESCLKVDTFAEKIYKVEPVISTPKPFSVVKASDVVTIPPDWMIEDLLLEKQCSIISAQPGSTKTWLTLELAIARASKTKAFGRFEVKEQGAVLIFNAEDSPGAITKPRLEALCRGKGLDLKTLPIYFVDTPTIRLDEETDKSRIESAVKDFSESGTPVFLVLDPFRNLHAADEDKSTAIAPVLEFLRQLNRKCGCAISLVHHDKKPGDDNRRKTSRMRGSSAIEGWRDTVLSIDEDSGIFSVNGYHRAARPPREFSYKLETDERDGALYWARLVIQESGQTDLAYQICGAIGQSEGKSANEICKILRVGRSRFYDELNRLKEAGKVTQDHKKKGLFLASGVSMVPVPVQEQRADIL